MIYRIFLFVLIVHSAIAKSLFIRYSTQQQSSWLFKYFHQTAADFYVDLGAYDPIYASNTIGLTSWKGINLEADRERLQNFILSRPNQINLHLAITNQTGGYATLFEYGEDSSASINPLNFKSLTDNGFKPKEQTVYQMTLADLCRKYYIKRPKFINIDLQEHGYVALNSNDWTTQKCVPQLILIQKLKNPSDNKKQREFLQSKFYSLQKQSQLNELYIYKQNLKQYRQVEQRGNRLLQDMRVQYWFPLYVSIFKTIAPQFQSQFENFKHLDPRTSPLFIHFAEDPIISIPKIRKGRNVAGNSQKPILIMHYNPLKSKLLLGSPDYTLSNIQAENQSLFLLTIKYQFQQQNVYILDHQINPQNPLQIVEAKFQQKLLKSVQDCEQKQLIAVRQKIVNVDNYLPHK